MAPLVQLVHNVISGSYKFTLGMEVAWRNPAKSVTPPRIVRKEANAPEIARAKRILDLAKEEDHLVDNILPTAAVLPLVNDGLPADRQLTLQQLGVRLRNLGFEHAKITSGDRRHGRRIDPEQLWALGRKFGLETNVDKKQGGGAGH